MRSVGLMSIPILAVCLLLGSCRPSSERQADAEYSRLQKASGSERLSAIKRAYYLYNRAIEEAPNPNTLSLHLRSRFIELSVDRARSILSEESVDAPPISIIQSDIEKYLAPDIPTPVKQQYAMLLVQIADSFSRQGLDLRAARYLDKALSCAGDRSAIAGIRQTMQGRTAAENLVRAQQEFATARSANDPASSLRAEYYTGAALLFDSTLPGARKLLADCRRANLGHYSDYRNVLENIPDTPLFKRVQKYDILLAATGISLGNGTSMTVHLYNGTYEPLLRLKPADFYLVDGSGTRYRAVGNEEIDPLDQFRQESFQLRFPGASGGLVKLVYDCPPHYSEKNF